MNSTDTKTWLVTGAGRGMGVELARAALAAGHNVVATGRNLDKKPPKKLPALLTSTSMRPKRSTAAATARSASSRTYSPRVDLMDGHTTYAGDEPRRPLCVEQ
jgi:NAD(P)-dependent dehydrogenase (short-subunit alcohol dehydrogenase family)